MKVFFVHGALVFDGAWWWHRMVEPLDALGMATEAVELRPCSGRLWRGYGRHVRRRRRGPRRAR
jgi:hypothetical protein